MGKGVQLVELDRDQKEGGREESLGCGSQGCQGLRAPRPISEERQANDRHPIAGLGRISLWLPWHGKRQRGLPS